MADERARRQRVVTEGAPPPIPSIQRGRETQGTCRRGECGTDDHPTEGPPPMSSQPVSLSDDEFDAVQRYAQPLAPHDRSHFLAVGGR